MTRDEEIQLVAIAEDISKTERRAMAAERDTVDRLIAMHLADGIGATFAGHVNGVTKAGLFVTLDETGADGFVPISKIANEFMMFDEDRRAVIGADSGEGWQMGDAVEVKLVEAQPLAGSLLFEMVSEAKKMDAATGGRHHVQTRNRKAKRTFQRRSSGKGSRR